MMTKEDIKKALGCCAKNDESACKDCPYNAEYYSLCSDEQMCKDALTLITEQEKEIERLKTENEELSKVVSSKVYDLIDNAKEIADAREAWEQQAKIDVLNELKEKCGSVGVIMLTDHEIDELIKELENADKD